MGGFLYSDGWGGGLFNSFLAVALFVVCFYSAENNNGKNNNRKKKHDDDVHTLLLLLCTHNKQHIHFELQKSKMRTTRMYKYNTHNLFCYLVCLSSVRLALEYAKNRNERVKN